MANTHSIDLERGSSQYLATASSPSGLNILGDITMEAWIKLEQLPTTEGTSSFFVISKDNVTDRPYSLIVSHITDKLRIFYKNNGDVATTSHECTTAFDGDDVGVWIHVACSIDVSVPTSIFYIDGVAKTTNEISSLAQDINTSTNPLWIGQVGNNSSRFDGLIDEVRVWDDIRTPTEIADNMSVELVGDEANLQGYWKLNNSYADETSNNNTMTPSGSPVFSASVPFSGAGISASRRIINA